ncbi:MAG: hypothetical protein ACLFNQ_12295, partial [Spirochaetaceae bacterium]
MGTKLTENKDKKFSGYTVIGLLLVSVVLMLSACPLPFEFTGGDGSGAISRDPSSPDVTPPVTFSYQQIGGSGGTVPEGIQEIFTSNDTTITLTTSMPGATIFFTDNGTALDSLSAAQSFSGSSGQLVLEIDNPSIENRTRMKEIQAVAVAPGMRPSPVRALTATVTYPFEPLALVSVSSDPDSALQAGEQELLRVVRIQVEVEPLTLESVTMAL